MHPSHVPSRRMQPARPAVLAGTLFAAVLAIGLAVGGSGSPVAASPASSAAVVRHAADHGLTGLSPAGLAPVGACHGLSLASATDCSDAELRALFCTSSRADDAACGTPSTWDR
jgi:hypothetical protein